MTCKDLIPSLVAVMLVIPGIPRVLWANAVAVASCPLVFGVSRPPTESEQIFQSLRQRGDRISQKHVELVDKLKADGYTPGRSWVYPLAMIRAFKDLQFVQTVYLAVEEFSHSNRSLSLLSLALSKRRGFSQPPRPGWAEPAIHVEVHPLTAFLSNDSKRFPRLEPEALELLEHIPTGLSGSRLRSEAEEHIVRILKTKFRKNLPSTRGLAYNKLEILSVESHTERRNRFDKFWVLAPYSTQRDGLIVKSLLVAVMEVPWSPSPTLGSEFVEIGEPTILNVFNTIELLAALERGQ